MRFLLFPVVLATVLVFLNPEAGAETVAFEPSLMLPPGADNPRNSEGDIAQLKDGRLLYVYTHFTGGKGGDHDSAHLAGRFSSDGGKTWTEEDTVILENEAGANVMSVSLLRLKDGDPLAFLYLKKESLDDCRPVVRFSSDEAKTWSEPVEVIPDSEVGYYVVNNDRLVQLSSGRLVIPAALHKDATMEKFDASAVIWCYLSDDGGQTWRRSKGSRDGRQADGSRVTLQEPGVVELKDGSLMMFARTGSGAQYVSYSKDEGETWSDFEASDLISPRSPASIERIPSKGDLVAVWNDHRDIPKELEGKRTPFTTAISKDEGKTWTLHRNLRDAPTGWYCYTAMEFVKDKDGDGEWLLLGHCAGDREKNNGLAESHITRVPVSWLYGE